MGTREDDCTPVPSKVWATFLTGEKYTSAVLTLDYALKKQKSIYPLVVLYTDSTPKASLEALDKRDILQHRIDELRPAASKDYGENSRFNDLWTKMRVFELTQYEKVVLLDSDVAIKQNMDELMEISLNVTDRNSRSIFAASHVCACNAYKMGTFPKNWIRENCIYTKQESDSENAQTVGYPSDSSVELNGGLLVVQPATWILDVIREAIKDENRTNNYSFAEQSMLSDVFRGRWIGLPYIYNAPRTIKLAHPCIWIEENVRNIHYVLQPKPWDTTPEEGKDQLDAHWRVLNKERKCLEKRQEIEDSY